MEKTNIKKEFHWFLLTDYEAEEALLRKRSKEGYRLLKILAPGIYVFEICEPEDDIYRLDFNQLSDEDMEAYLQIYNDYGWDYVTELNDYYYFRKAAKDIKLEEEAEIFCDSESKLAMLKSILLKKMVPILLVFLACGAIDIMNTFMNLYDGILKDIISVVWCIVFLYYLYVIIHCAMGYFRLKKKYSHE